MTTERVTIHRPRRVTEFTLGKIADPQTRWGKSLSLMRSILTEDKLPTIAIAKTMVAGIIRAQLGLMKDEADEGGSLTPWQSSPMDVPELKDFYTHRSLELPDLTSHILERLIKSPEMQTESLEVVGRSLLPYLFLRGSQPLMLVHVANLHRRLLEGGVDKTNDFAQFALKRVDEKVVPISDIKLKQQWLFRSRFAAVQIYMNAGQHKEAREVVNNEALSPHDRELLRRMFFWNS